MTLEEKAKKFPVTCYARIVGWMTPVKSWNKGKLSEWRDRVTFKIKKDVE